MPELPEVEVLARHLRPLVLGKSIRGLVVRRAKVIGPTSESGLGEGLTGARFTGLERRGKYLLFELKGRGAKERFVLVGHLGMTGRIFLARRGMALPKHAAVVLELGRENFIFEDTRYFGRMTLDTRSM